MKKILTILLLTCIVGCGDVERGVNTIPYCDPFEDCIDYTPQPEPEDDEPIDVFEEEKFEEDGVSSSEDPPLPS